MATKIITKNSSTTTAIPTAGDLVQGELAVNVTDKRLFTENSAGAIVELGTNPSTLDVTGAATFSGAVSLSGVAQSDSITNTIYLQNTAGTRAGNIQLDASGGVSIFDYNGAAWRKSLTLEGGAATFSGTVTAGGLTVDGNTYLGANSGSMSLILAGNTTTTGGFIYEDQNQMILSQVTAAPIIFRTTNTERLRLDANGNLGLGVTPSAWNSSTPALQILNASIYGYGNYECGVQANLYYDGAGWKHISTAAATQYQQASGKHTWLSGSSASAGAVATMATNMTLDASGSLRINGSIGYFGEKFTVTNSTSYTQTSVRTGTGNEGHIVFRNANGAVGTIFTNGSATSYNTSSDYRLKEDDVPMTGATERVKALRPINFAWKVDGSRTDGFFAHEAQEVVPECATGSKDAMRDEEYEVTPAVEEVRDEDGNVTTEAVPAVMGTRSVPDYQGIDQSKLVPLLTAALQEAIAKIEDLTARLEALEGA